MSNPLKKLAGQTAIYGLPSIVARLLNYLLVPLHTGVFVAEQFGIVTEMYSYVAFLVVLLTWGMETAFFRFISKENASKNAFSTILFSLMASVVVFVILALVFDQQVANTLQYPDNSEYVVWFALIVGLDAITAIPMARLRQDQRVKKFVLVNVVNILVNIGLNMFFLLYIWKMGMAGEHNWLVDALFDKEIGVGYIFIANLVASGCKFALLLPEMFQAHGKWVLAELKVMFMYGAPLLIGNLAIIVNEVLDKPMLKYMLADDYGPVYAQEQVGIYGACAKLSILMMMFIQAFRYAAEPFFFNKEKDKDAKLVYAVVMKYFVIICTVIFLGVVLYMDLLKHFIRSTEYWEGLQVVPILLMAYICYGIWYNLAIWYKLGGKTRYGAYIPLVGACLTVLFNILWIPSYGYMGSAYATLIAYGAMMILSYFLGQKHNPIKYPVGKILFYLAAAVGIYFLLDPVPGIIEHLGVDNLDQGISWSTIAINTLVLLGYAALIYVLERPKKSVN
jgi:O-antigen/teichoic acid export membrane protein